MKIGERWWVRMPDGDMPDDVARTALTVPRGAFGSGEHETTRSCLEVIERLPNLEGARVLDVGSGTGILSVAALKLGAAAALCVDIDAKAAATNRLTAKMNDVSERTTVILGYLEVITEHPHDLIVANLYGDVLLEIAPSIVSFLAPGGKIVLSGIAWEYAFPVRQLFESLGRHKLEEKWLEEFVTMVFG